MDNVFAWNATTDHGLVADDRDDGRLVIVLIAEMLVFLLGMPGNCLILRVYWTKTRKTSTDILIRYLAWADLSVCLLMIPVIVSQHLTGDSFFLEHFHAVIGTFTVIALGSSFSITAIIAVERYDCICRPQKRFFNLRRSKISVLIAVLLITAIGTGQLALYIIHDIYEESGTEYVSLQVYASLLVVKPVVFGIALVTIGSCYGKVYATVRKHVKVGPVQAPTANVERRPGAPRVERQGICSTRPTPPHQNELPTRESFVDEAVTRFVNPPAENPTTETDSYKLKSEHDTGTSATYTVSCAHQGPSGLSQPNVIPKAKTAPDENAPSQKQIRPVPGHAPQRVGAAKLQRKTTRMVFITSVVFILTWTPYMIFVVKFYSSPYDQFEGIIGAISSIILLINSVANPLIYGIANSRIRKECKKVIRNIKCCKCT